jgi:hypothetical protein
VGSKPASSALQKKYDPLEPVAAEQQIEENKRPPLGGFLFFHPATSRPAISL